MDQPRVPSTTLTPTALTVTTAAVAFATTTLTFAAATLAAAAPFLHHHGRLLMLQRCLHGWLRC